MSRTSPLRADMYQGLPAAPHTKGQLVLALFHCRANETRIFPERPPRAACATASLILRIG